MKDSNIKTRKINNFSMQMHYFNIMNIIKQLKKTVAIFLYIQKMSSCKKLLCRYCILVSKFNTLQKINLDQSQNDKLKSENFKLKCNLTYHSDILKVYLLRLAKKFNLALPRVKGQKLHTIFLSCST